MYHLQHHDWIFLLNTRCLFFPPACTSDLHVALYFFFFRFTLSFVLSVLPSSGHNEGTIAVAEGELLYVIEEDKGDGWTRVRRNEDEEGYVPTSYVEVFLETNAKGAMTYI